ncbi:MAG: hypothetical protein E6J84_13860, partial [Deltaproteobacteria bacterium]
EQQQLGDMVQRFFAEQYGFDARRKILESREGWSREIWSKMAELGLLSLQVPEEQGGMAPAVVETLLTATATGAAMLLEPWVSSAIIGTVLIRELGSAQQREEMLVPMAAGERIAVPAHFEPAARYDLHRVATSARRGGGGWVLKGRKSVVLHAPAADLLLVSARTSGAADEATGISVFAVPREGPGVALSQYRTLDGVCAADVELADAPGTLIGADGTAFAALATAFDQGLAVRCAEAVGALQATEPSRRERRRALAAAKVVVGNACRYVGQEAVQLHGGMGVTDEIAVSHLFRRLTALEMALGDTAHHLEQFVAASAQAEGT